MRDFARIVALAGAALCVSSTYSIRAQDSADYDLAPGFRQRRGKGQNNRRGKGKSSAPKERPNRLTISKRVRRKHRRAA